MSDIGVSRPFDYTSRDFESLSADLVTRMRTAIPEWTAYEQGFEKILLDLFAYVGDIQNFYIDRMANEFFLRSAALRESILNISQMFGYRPGAQTAALVTLTLTRGTGITGTHTIPAGTAFYAQSEGQPPINFETDTAATMGSGMTSIEVAATEGKTYTEQDLGLSSGAEQQVFQVFHPQVIHGSVRVYTDEGAADPSTSINSLIEWTYYERLIDSDFNDRAFTTYVDEDGYTSVIFGDGVSGLIPAFGAQIKATYRVGVGALGNVGPGTIRSWVGSPPLLSKFSSVTNVEAAQGGANAETMESMRTSIPRSVRAIDRAVTLQDHADLTLKVSGVAKANALGATSTSVIVYLAPVGGGQPSAKLIESVQNFLVPTRVLAGTTLTFIGPVYVPVHITLDIVVAAQQRQDRVIEAINLSLARTFSFDNRSFGERITKGLVFQAVATVPGVEYVNISAFNRDGSGFDADFTMSPREIAKLGTVSFGVVTGGIQLT